LRFFLIFARGPELFLLASRFGWFLLVDSGGYPYMEISSEFIRTRTRSNPCRSSSSLPRPRQMVSELWLFLTMAEDNDGLWGLFSRMDTVARRDNTFKRISLRIDDRSL